MKIKSGILFVALMVAGASAQAMMDFDFNPYAGFDLGMRRMEYSNTYGGQAFVKNYAQGNLFVGTKLNPNVGVELGYTQTNNRKKSYTLSPGESAFTGAVVAAGTKLDVKTKSRVSGFNVSVLGFYPIDDCNEVIGAIGLASQKVRLSMQPLGDENGAFTVPAQQLSLRTISKSKTILTARLGVEHKFTDNLGVRALVGWENTSRFKKLQSKPVASAFATAKDSVTGNVGVVWHF